MTKLITAKDAAGITELAKHNKEADELLKPIAVEIQSEAKRGYSTVVVDGREWYKTSSLAHKLAISKLENAGYCMTDHTYQYAPNGDQPSDYYGIEITW